MTAKEKAFRAAAGIPLDVELTATQRASLAKWKQPARDHAARRFDLLEAQRGATVPADESSNSARRRRK